MCARSLDILNPKMIIHSIEVASRVALGGTSAEEAGVLTIRVLDAQKFDMALPTNPT